MSTDLVWSVDEHDHYVAHFADRKVADVVRRDCGADWSAAVHAPDFRCRRRFDSREAAIEWAEAEWRDFVRLMAAARNGGW